MQLRHEGLPARLEGREVGLAEHAAEGGLAGRVVGAVRAELAVEAGEEAALLEVVAEVAGVRVVGARVPRRDSTASEIAIPRLPDVCSAWERPASVRSDGLRCTVAPQASIIAFR